VDGRMLVYGSLTGEGISVGDDPRLTLSGRRTLEVFWLGYWLMRLNNAGFFPSDRPAIWQLIKEIAQLTRQGVLGTSPGKKFDLDDIHAALQGLADEGVEVVILGCTELPLLLPHAFWLSASGQTITLVDPSDILAKRCVGYATAAAQLEAQR